jgi:hypothetical protein
MPVEGSVPPACRAAIAVSGGRVLIALLPLCAAACATGPEPHLLQSERSADGKRIAMVRLAPCGRGWCETLWVGSAPEDVARLATLAKDTERCDEIAWRKDGKRVAFLVDGYQLRLYDPDTNGVAGLVDLVQNDGRPTTRIARGVTFSDNGAAVTFDDCPRDRSGCKPGMVGIR